MSDGSEDKWACEFCTYENFPAAKKCTMCFKWRAPHLISDTINEEQDIYKMAPLVSNPSSETNVVGICSSSEGSKWACEFCTYLNWAKSSKCVQCLNPKRKSSPPASGPQDKLQILSVNTSESHSSGNTTPIRVSPNCLPNNSMTAKSSNNGKNLSKHPLFHNPSKWICLKCTYENWPRSLKCVICGSPKDKIIGDGQPGVGSSRSNEITTPQRQSPTSSLSGRGIVDRFEQHGYQAGASASSFTLSSSSTHPSSPPLAREKRLAVWRSKLRDSDWLWLNACMGAVDGDMESIHAFIAGGGHPSRQLTVQEVELLDRPSAFQAGYTLVHLAIRFQREDMLAILLTATDAAAKATKRLPCMACPDIATDIRRQVVSSLRQRKGDFPCHFLTDCVTFSLPADIEDLARQIQKQLFDEILDRDVQNELEVEEAIINWSIELTDRLGSRLYALWNRTAGDCLLDSVLQATWGVFDLDNSLRRALADSLREGAMK